MASVAAPMAPRPSPSSLLDMPRNKHKREQRPLDATAHEQETLQMARQRRQEAQQRAEAASHTRAVAFLHDFLERSPAWSAIIDQITIVRDAVPTMEELESYGDMDEVEGTQTCRRLFKAVVVWDELGHSLWERLHTIKQQKKAALKGLGPMLRMGVVGDGEDSGYASSAAAPSQNSTATSSPNLSLDAGRPKRSQTMAPAWEIPVSRCRSQADELYPIRSSTEPVADGGDGAECAPRRRRASENSRPAIPKLCANAVRKTLEVFTDGRSVSGRRSR